MEEISLHNGALLMRLQEDRELESEERLRDMED